MSPLPPFARGDGNGSGAPYQLPFDLGAVTHVQFPDDAVLRHPGDDILRSFHQHLCEHGIRQAFRDPHEVAIETILRIGLHFHVFEFGAGGFPDNAFDLLKVGKCKAEETTGKSGIAAAAFLRRALQEQNFSSQIMGGESCH